MTVNGYNVFESLKNAVPDLPDIRDIPSDKLPITKEIRYIDKTVSTVIDQAPAATLKVGIGVLIIVIGWMLTGWFAVRLNRWLTKARMEETLAAFLASTARFVLFFNIFIIALTVIGVSSTSLAAVIGAIGLAVGFALRTTLGSIAGGIMLMAHRPFKVGDWVEITSPQGSPSGTVKRIGLFSTEINTQEFVRVFVPNAMMWEGVVRNDTYNRMRMLTLHFGLGYEVDVRNAFKIMKGIFSANPLVLRSPEPTLGVDSFGDHGIVCVLQVWVRTEDLTALRHGILLDVMEALGKAGIRMAHMDKPEKPIDKDKEATLAAQEAVGLAPKNSADMQKGGSLKEDSKEKGQAS